MESSEPVGGSATHDEPLSTSDGDILLRANLSMEQIRLVSGEYSHSGICNDGARREVVDAFPYRDPHAVARSLLDAFFSQDNADGGGGIFRYSGEPGQSEIDARYVRKAAAAARYAADQCTVPYYFDLYDPIVGRDLDLIDNQRVYCSEFVWRCFRFGANVVLVLQDDFVDLWAERGGKPVMVPLARAYVQEQVGQLGRLIPDWVLGGSAGVYAWWITHNGRYLTPDQLAQSRYVRLVRKLPPAGKSP